MDKKSLIEELVVESDKLDKLHSELSELEKEPLVRRFLDVRFRYGSASGRVSVLKNQLGHATFREHEEKEQSKNG